MAPTGRWGSGAAPADQPGPWVEKHRPAHLGQVMGHTEQVRKLAEWLRDWEDVCLKGKKKEIKEEPGKEWMKFKPVPDNWNARAALISGPPGIGKTTTCVLVARCNPKYKVMEFNASDARSKKKIEAMNASLAGNTTLSLRGAKQPQGKALEKACIIMDECDGMAEGDIGGQAALMNMIKETKNPIICICNEYQKVRKLAPLCMDIKFWKPEVATVCKRIKHVMEKEGKKVNMVALEMIAEACGNDIRQVINQVQFFGTLAQSKDSTGKDTAVAMSVFEACSNLFNTSTGAADGKAYSVKQKLDMYYIDSQIMPLFVQENYLRRAEAGLGSRHTNEVEQLEACAYAAELQATGDALSKDWEVMNSAAIIGTVYPSYLMSSEKSNIKSQFPAWFQRKGPVDKARRTVQELHSKIRTMSGCNARNLVTTNYHDILHRRLVHPLLIGDVKGCAQRLSSCGLSREFFTDQAPVFREPLKLQDDYKKVEGTNKTKLLTEMNALQVAQASRVVSSSSGKKRKAAETQAGDAGEEEDDGGNAKEDGDDDMVTVKKKTKKQDGKAAKAGKKSGGDMPQKTAISLGSWKKRAVVADEENDAGQAVKGPTLILKFIEGHTNAVRRQVSFKELLGPWRDF